jgi:hypothetical protein
MSPKGARQLQELGLSKRKYQSTINWFLPAYSYVMTAAIVQSLTDHFPCFLPLRYIVLTHSPNSQGYAYPDPIIEASRSKISIAIPSAADFGLGIIINMYLTSY